MNKFIIAATLGIMGASFNANALGNLAEITIFDRVQNRTLPVYKHNGHYYVAGKPGNAYQIHVENRQTDSIEAVISVDAVNVITGKTARSSQNGYIFASYDSYDIAGWRKNQDEVAAFYFTEIANSYAARTGRSGNVGVIGVAIYNKKPEVVYELPRPQISRHADAVDSESARLGMPQQEQQVRPQSAPSATATAPQGTLSKSTSRQEAQIKDKSAESKKLGTGHGAIESSYVTEVEFERASTRPNEVITIYYDSYKNLVAQGIVRPQARKPMPKPFIDDANNGFVPDPS